MTAELWPPPPSGESVFEVKPVLDGGWSRLRLRRVPLWGRQVWLDDESGRVWCDRCCRLVDVVELARPDTRHPSIGLRGRREGVLLPMRGHGQEGPDDAA